MRLDLFLKASRLIPRRSLAQDFCDAGRIKMNGVKAKSSREAKAGDEIEIKRPNKISTYKILQIPASKQVSREQSSNLYEVVSEVSTGDSLLEKNVAGDNNNNPTA